MRINRDFSATENTSKIQKYIKKKHKQKIVQCDQLSVCVCLRYITAVGIEHRLPKPIHSYSTEMSLAASIMSYLQTYINAYIARYTCVRESGLLLLLLDIMLTYSHQAAYCLYRVCVYINMECQSPAHTNRYALPQFAHAHIHSLATA